MESSAKKRTCLRCNKRFDSHGPGNRICGTCKRDQEYRMRSGCDEIVSHLESRLQQDMVAITEYYC